MSDKKEIKSILSRFSKSSEEILNINLLESEAKKYISGVAGVIDYVRENPSQTTLSMANGALELMDGIIKEAKLAGTDLLTELPNRRAYEDMGDITLARLNREDIGSAALLFIDVVKFKDFNTNYGHNVGDEALVEIANKLKSSVRDTDFVARIAGDEFIVLAVNKDKGHDFTPIRDSIYEGFKTAYIEHDGKDIPLAVSVGIADLTRNDNLVAAQERADTDMYQEKEIQHRALEKQQALEL